MWIDDREVHGAGERIERRSPAHGALVTSVPRGSDADARAAVAAARRAFDNGGWPRETAANRPRLVLRVAEAGLPEGACNVVTGYGPDVGAPSRILKKSPRTSARDRVEGWRQPRGVRNLVRRRGPHRSEEQDHASLGQARNEAIGPARSAHRLDLHLRRDLPRQRQGRRPRSALCNTQAMNLHLQEIGKAVAPGNHAVLLLDQAGWRMSAKLTVPSNVTLVALPPKCPELNPTENVRQFMRENWLSNRVFKSYDDIVDHCCYAWNKLIEQPWRIISIGMRDCARRF
jgi:hypothetical protein